MTYPNAIERITVEEAQRLYDFGVCVIIDEGTHVTLVDEYPDWPWKRWDAMQARSKRLCQLNVAR